ncbi:hypothetical protein [Endozoicomonas sp. ONNA2]|uniref:hypothetical protein n=1 Tax=Endozoicomonas sp. ONNA2 TaxID=2828741 RepID=UPI0021490397|nr:hypothetical protein [Endozoicomonas sp. ONNA2]
MVKQNIFHGKGELFFSFPFFSFLFVSFLFLCAFVVQGFYAFCNGLQETRKLFRDYSIAHLWTGTASGRHDGNDQK